MYGVAVSIEYSMLVGLYAHGRPPLASLICCCYLVMVEKLVGKNYFYQYNWQIQSR